MECVSSLTLINDYKCTFGLRFFFCQVRPLCFLCKVIILIPFTQFQADLVEPAVKGTINVLQSCTKVPSIKRVVITSSMASVMVTGKPLAPDVVMDETWFSSPALCEEQKVCVHQ